MINILIPLAGRTQFFDSNEYKFPKPLIEVNGLPMIERVIDNFNIIKDNKKFIFIVNKSECEKFHLDSSLKLLTENRCKIIKLDNFTKGAACSSLMAIKHIDNNDPLIISNGDQIILHDLNEVLNFFKSKNYDAGVITFDSVHPRWSYASINEDEQIIETSEKKPISRNAIAGFYYFKNGKDFVNSAMRSIEKDANIDGAYYIAPTLNEMILNGKNLGIYKISNSNYHTFYSPQKIFEYEKEKSII